MKKHNSLKTLLGALIVSVAGLGLTAPAYADKDRGHRGHGEYSHQTNHKEHSYKGHKRHKHGHDRHYSKRDHYRQDKHHYRHDARRYWNHGHKHHDHRRQYSRLNHTPRHTYYDSPQNIWDFVVRYHYDD